jgi:CheY-like chemotaxis protein
MSSFQEHAFRVLVVDDNRDAARILALLLRKSGHDVRTANGGAEALEVAADFRPECIISDIGMPGLDGYELAKRLRSDQRFKEIPLIALTAYTDSEKVRNAGFDHHLVKPANLTAIVPLLAQFQGLKSAVARMQDTADAQSAAISAVKDMMHEIKDDVQDLKTGLKEDVAALKSELKEEIQELKEELREVREIKEELIEGEDRGVKS